MKKLRILLEDVTFPRVSLSVDQQIDDLLHKAEREAVQVAMQNQVDGVEESVNKLSVKFLFEEEESEEKDKPPPFDVATFSTQIIRYLTMYKKITDIPDIIDIPAVIANRAVDFLKKKYGEDISKQFMDDISKDPDVGGMVNFKDQSSMDDIEQPLAVGAGGGSSGGGAV